MKVIDLDLNTELENKLYHEIHETHSHFYYNMWELVNSPVEHPSEEMDEWITLSTTYNSKGKVSKVELMIVGGKQ